jgi:hypothetical protein
MLKHWNSNSSIPGVSPLEKHLNSSTRGLVVVVDIGSVAVVGANLHSSDGLALQKSKLSDG